MMHWQARPLCSRRGSYLDPPHPSPAALAPLPAPYSNTDLHSPLLPPPYSGLELASIPHSGPQTTLAPAPSPSVVLPKEVPARKNLSGRNGHPWPPSNSQPSDLAPSIPISSPGSDGIGK